MQPDTQRHMPEPSDALGQTLYSIRLDGLVYAQSELTAPWGISMPSMAGKMMFHIVTQGHCWLRLSDQEPVLLEAGDLVLLPSGEGHDYASHIEQTCTPFFDIPVKQLSPRFESMHYGGGGDLTLLTCGVLSFDHVAGEKLIQQLPNIIHIKKNARSPSNQLTQPLLKQLYMLVELMKEEALTLGTGGETLVAHLADIIVIKAIRYWIDRDYEANSGWLAALRDPKIGKALNVIHTHPEMSWTVERLAEQAGMSRSGFSARFTELLGTSAKQYVTEWRMNLAQKKIAQSPIALIDLAEALGYTSEAAFSRAYKRVFGVPPLRQARRVDE